MRSILWFLVISCTVLVIKGQSSRDISHDDDRTGGSRKSEKLARVPIDRNEVVRGDGSPKDKFSNSKDDDDDRREIFDKKDSTRGSSRKSTKIDDESVEETTKRRRSKSRTTTEGSRNTEDYDDVDNDKPREHEKKNRKSSAKSHTDDNGSSEHMTQWIFGELKKLVREKVNQN